VGTGGGGGSSERVAFLADGIARAAPAIGGGGGNAERFSFFRVEVGFLSRREAETEFSRARDFEVVVWAVAAGTVAAAMNADVTRTRNLMVVSIRMGALSSISSNAPSTIVEAAATIC
jgi:hypothetical protein